MAKDGKFPHENLKFFYDSVPKKLPRICPIWVAVARGWAEVTPRPLGEEDFQERQQGDERGQFEWTRYKVKEG